MHLHYGDLIDGNSLVKIVSDTKPTEIYNLGAQSHVKVIKSPVIRCPYPASPVIVLAHVRTKYDYITINYPN